MSRTDTEYIPDASKFYQDLEHSAKGLSENLQELIDNAIDANATEISIKLRPKKTKTENYFCISIKDNGNGFDSFQDFKNGIKSGSADVKHKPDAIGKFGKGMKQCAFALSANSIIVSKNKNGKTFFAHLDTDTMIAKNTYNPTQILDDPHISTLTGYFACDEDYQDFSDMSNGTMIILTRLKPEYNKNIDYQKKELISSFSIAYKHNLPVKIDVNGDNVTFVDFMYEKIENFDKLEYNSNLKLRVYKNPMTDTLDTYMHTPKEMNIAKKSIIQSGWYKFNLDAHAQGRNNKYLSDVILENQLPEGEFYVLDIRAISIKEPQFKIEDKDTFEKFPKTCGTTTIRGKYRYVKHFEPPRYFKIDDYYNRRRLLMTFPPELDNYFGINASKQQGYTKLSDDIPKIEKILWSLTHRVSVNSMKKPKQQSTSNESSSKAPHVSTTPPVFKASHVSTTPPVFKAPHVSTTPPVFKAPHVSTTPTVSKASHVSTTPPVFKASHVSTTPPVFKAPHVSTTPPVFKAPHVSTTSSISNVSTSKILSDVTVKKFRIVFDTYINKMQDQDLTEQDIAYYDTIYTILSKQKKDEVL